MKTFADDPTPISQRTTTARLGRSIALALPWLAFPLSALATPLGQPCTTIDSAQARLACYDQALGRSEAPPSAVEATHPAEVTVHNLDIRVPAAPTATNPDFSPLSQVWELRTEEKQGTFRLQPHRANYLLPVNHTSRINARPSSPAPDRSVPFDLPIDSTEAKFQLSFKAKAWENVLGDNGDLWVAYTQQSNWQLYNGGISAPFRETNYEPEVIFSLRTDTNIFGWRWRMLNLGFVHQSNGRPLPLSRSWNRIYAQFGLERGPFTLLVRPWYRLPEDPAEDDNPDIRDYMGSGDIQLAYAGGGHVLSTTAHYSGKGGRGGLKAEWAFPVSGSLKGYVQLTTGYGASLIDYNHKQTTLGVGFLLLPWQ